MTRNDAVLLVVPPDVTTTSANPGKSALGTGATIFVSVQEVGVAEMPRMLMCGAAQAETTVNNPIRAMKAALLIFASMVVPSLLESTFPAYKPGRLLQFKSSATISSIV